MLYFLSSASLPLSPLPLMSISFRLILPRANTLLCPRPLRATMCFYALTSPAWQSADVAVAAILYVHDQSGD